MMTEFKRTQRDYPLSFKIAVVEQVEKGEMMFIRRFTDKKLSTYIRTSQSAIFTRRKLRIFIGY